MAAYSAPVRAWALISQRFGRNNAWHKASTFDHSLPPIESVHSAVYAMRSEALASRAFAAADSARGRACLRHLLESEDATAKREGVTVREPLFTQIEVAGLPSARPGMRVFGLRMTAGVGIEAPGTKVRSNYYEDSLAFVMGSTVITLTDTGSPHPFPATTERRLLSLLYSRARAVSKCPAGGRTEPPC